MHSNATPVVVVYVKYWRASHIVSKKYYNQFITELCMKRFNITVTLYLLIILQIKGIKTILMQFLVIETQFK